MGTLRVKWTKENKYWSGDNYAGGWVHIAPPEEIHGEIVGFDNGKAIVLHGTSLSLMDFDDLTVELEPTHDPL